MWPKYFAGLLLLWLSCLLLVRAAIVPVTEAQDKDGDKPESTSSNSTLELVQVLLRHGPRTPVNTYPKDPYLTLETFAPYGWGQLTNGAKVELYKIGQQLRKRYKELLPPYYQPDLLHAEATQSPRTIMSLQMVLAGLFPPENTPMEWNMLLNWQPIPIYTEPEATDKRLRQKVPCPRYEEAVWEVMQLPEVVALHEQNSQMLRELTELTGLNVSYAHDVTSVFITLLAEQAFGLKLPPWTEKYFPDKMRSLAAQSYFIDAYTRELRKLKGGYYLADVYKKMQSKIAGKLEPAGRKMFISCAHDWSIANVLSALNVWPNELPRFSALIAIELHRRTDSGDYFVEIHFQNDPDQPPQLLPVPGCGKQCPVAKLMELSQDVLPDAPYEQLCVAKGTGDGGRISYHK